MQKYFLTTPLIVFFCIVLVFLYFLIIQRDPAEIPSVLINKKAPAFQAESLLKDEIFIFQEKSGQEITVVNFFATWCVPCKLEHPFINKLSKDKGIKIIGINYKDDRKKAIKWLEKLGNPYHSIAIDKNGNIGINWGVRGIPETFIVNSHNIVSYRQTGPITNEIYEEFYQKVLEGKK